MDISTEDDDEDAIKATHAGGTTATPADITIDVTGTSTKNTLSTAGARSRGIYGEHTGTGNVDIDVEGVTITTSGIASKGIYGKHGGDGNVDIGAAGVSISTTGTSIAEGVIAEHTGTGDITIDIQGSTDGTTRTPSTITTATGSSRGIFAHQSPGTGKTGGDIAITMGDTQIETIESQGHGIFALQEPASTGAITATLNPGTVISTMGGASAGVYLHSNAATTAAADSDITLIARGITVSTLGGVSGRNTHGLWVGQHSGRGDVIVDVRDSTVTTEHPGERSNGIRVSNRNNANSGIDIDVTGGSTTTKGTFSHGIYAGHEILGDPNPDASGDITIDLLGHAIRAEGTGFFNSSGTFSYGIYGWHQNSGNIVINMQQGSSVTTLGQNSHGIVAYHLGTAAGRTIDITVGGPVTVNGESAQGVRVGAIVSGVPARMGDLDDEGYRRQTVTVNDRISSQGPGIYLTNGGRVIIGPRGSIGSAEGIAILATGTVPEDDSEMNNVIPAIPPKLRVDLNPGGRRIAQVLDDDWILNDGGETTLAVNNVMLHDGATGVTGNTAPNGAWNVRMLGAGVKVTDRSTDPWTISMRDENTIVIADRDFSADDFTEIRRPTPPPPAPPPPQRAMHEVNTAISTGTDAMAGIHIEGDGTVTIGPQGSLRAASGIAILAEGDEPDLLVDFTLGGRSVMEVIGDDWIINDGTTTIVVNGVKLHDGTTGVVPGVTAPNGAFNVRTEGPEVRIREAGVRVLDHTDPDPANWTVSDPVAGLITDRDFSAMDFIETVDGVVPTPPMFIEEYAPRAALYEVLPDLLLRLNEPVASASLVAPSGIRVFTKSGSHKFESSTVGAHYDTDVQGIEIAKPFALGPLEASATLQYLNATAEVSSPVQGGDIDVEGLGLSLQLCRGCAQGKGYVSGQLSFSRYDLDLVSDTRGRLKSGVDATASALHLEAGRHLERETLQLTPRVRLDYANVSVERFTDAVDARISYSDETRLTAALGILAETGRSGTQGTYTLWGSVDVESRLDGVRTTARVSGERLKARAGDHSLLLGAGATWTWGALDLDASLQAREELDTGGEDYTASLHFHLPF